MNIRILQSFIILSFLALTFNAKASGLDLSNFRSFLGFSPSQPDEPLIIRRETFFPPSNVIVAITSDQKEVILVEGWSSDRKADFGMEFISSIATFDRQLSTFDREQHLKSKRNIPNLDTLVASSCARFYAGIDDKMTIHVIDRKKLKKTILIEDEQLSMPNSLSAAILALSEGAKFLAISLHQKERDARRPLPLRILDPENETSYVGEALDVKELMFTDKGNMLIAKSRDQNYRLFIRGFSVPTLEEVFTFDPGNNDFEGADMIAGGTIHAISKDGVLFHIRNKSQDFIVNREYKNIQSKLVSSSYLPRPPVAQVVTSCFSGNNELIAIALADGTIQIWNLNTEHQIAMLPSQVYTQDSNTFINSVYSLSFSPDGLQLLVTYSRTNVLAWNIPSTTVAMQEKKGI